MSSSGHLEIIDRLLFFFDIHVRYIACHDSDIFRALVHVPFIFFTGNLLWQVKPPIIWNKKIYAVWWLMLVTILSAIIYFLGKCSIAPHVSLAFGFCITICLLVSLYLISQEKSITHVTWFDACLLGMVQGIAVVPGISRLGIVFVTLRWRGVSARDAYMISWLIFIPLIFGVCLKSILELYLCPSIDTIFFLPGIWVSWIAGSICAGILFWQMYYCVQTPYMWLFGIYVILPLLLSFVI